MTAQQIEVEIADWTAIHSKIVANAKRLRNPEDRAMFNALHVEPAKQILDSLRALQISQA